MPVSPARAARLVRRTGDISFDTIVDPRDSRGKRHSLQGLLSLMVAGLAGMKLTFRDIEDFGSDLPRKTRRRMGLNRRPSDTTMYELVGRVAPDGLREAVFRQVRADLDSKAITNDLLPGGVLTVDGKCAGSGLGASPSAQVRQSVCDSKGTACWNAFTLRACLTSSSVRPILDQEFIDSKGSESPSFRVVFARVVERFPKLFRYVTVDANMTSADSAKLIRQHDKHYVFAVKGNRKNLQAKGDHALADGPVLACQTELYRGATVRRELSRAAADGVGLADAQEFWRVVQTRVEPSGECTIEQRTFVASIPAAELSDIERLRLVRMHWGIENGPNWTADVILNEDEQTPCTNGDGVVVMSWLRCLAYNVLSVFRAHLPKRDGKPERWKRAAELAWQAFVLLAPAASQFEELATLA